MSKSQKDFPELAEFNSLIDSTMRERRCTRDKASAIVSKRYPDLHARVVAEANADRPAAMRNSRFRDEG